jgi:hypothetical protein
MATLINLSLEPANKVRIMCTDVVPTLVEVEAEDRCGKWWQIFLDGHGGNGGAGRGGAGAGYEGRGVRGQIERTIFYVISGNCG